MRRLAAAFTVIRRRGLGYLAYLVTGVLLPKLYFRLLYQMQPSQRRLLAGLAGAGLIGAWLGVASALGSLRTGAFTLLALVAVGLVAALAARWLRSQRVAAQARALTAESASASSEFTSWEEWPVQPATRQAVESARRAQPPDEPLVLGRFDQQGRVLSCFGNLPGLRPVSESDFFEGNQSQLSLVLLSGQLLVRKDFRGRRAPFLREWRALAALKGKANVPALFQVEEDHCVLYRDFIPGRTAAEVLKERRGPAAGGASAVNARGGLAEDFLTELQEQLDQIHFEGVTGLGLSPEDVLVAEGDGAPWLWDFGSSRTHDSKANFWFAYGRDLDRSRLNEGFGCNLLTEQSAREALAERTAVHPGWYSPIDFGCGLTTTGFWSTDSGTGRWDYFNHDILKDLLPGKRILDLGSNNALMPLMMLRNGAREVVGLELDEAYVASAKVVHRLLEWRDIRRYSLNLLHANMLEVLRANWGAFDIVTAFCSLYYLTPEEMAQVVRKCAELAPIMVLQAKTDTRDDAPEDKAAKSSLAFLQDLLAQNGFPETEVHAPPGFSRPIVIGRGGRRAAGAKAQDDAAETAAAYKVA